MVLLRASFCLSFLVPGYRLCLLIIKSTSASLQINPLLSFKSPSPLHLITSTCSILCFLHSFKSEIITSIAIRGLPQASFLFENHYLLHDEGVRTTQIPLIL